MVISECKQIWQVIFGKDTALPLRIQALTSR